MKQRFIVLLFAITVLASSNVKSQEVEVIKFDRLQKLIDEKSEGIKVINFWATWCAPCIKELPYFEAVSKNDQRVEVTLISLDFADRQALVNKFIDKKNIQSQVLLLDEIDYNSWIDKVDKSWTGAIPATLIIDGTTGKRKFVEKELHEGELETLINHFTNN